MQRVGLGVKCNGLVVGGGQISDFEQEGEEELRKKREKGGSLAGTISVVGRRDLGGGGDTIWAAVAWLGGHLCSLSLSLSLSPGNHLKVK